MGMPWISSDTVRKDATCDGWLSGMAVNMVGSSDKLEAATQPGAS